MQTRFTYKPVKHAQTVKPIGKIDGTTIGQMTDKIYRMAAALDKQDILMTEEEREVLTELRAECFKLDLIVRGYQVDPGSLPESYNPLR